MYKILLSICIVLITNGCASKLYDAETLHQKGADLTKITRKAKVAIRNNISSEELYLYMSNKYPEDMASFTEYKIFMKRDKDVAIVLMCDSQGEKALLEDLSCTGALEGGYHFKKELQCDFHLNIKDECKK